MRVFADAHAHREGARVHRHPGGPAPLLAFEPQGFAAAWRASHIFVVECAARPRAGVVALAFPPAGKDGVALQADERSWAREVPGFAPLRSLRVVSWNVHQCVGLDARYAPERIARVLRELAPDIVGLQEVDTGRPALEALHQLDFLARATDMVAVAGFNLRRETGDYGNALLSRLPVREVRRLDLSIPRREPRGALDVELAAPGGGGLRVIVTHFGLNPKERRIQADRLGRAIDGHAAGLPTVLVGDLNEWFPEVTRRLAALADRFEQEFAGRSFPAPAPFLALDRIYVAPQPASARCRVWRGWPARLASDHLPLVVDLAFEARPQELRAPGPRAARRRGQPALPASVP